MKENMILWRESIASHPRPFSLFLKVINGKRTQAVKSKKSLTKIFPKFCKKKKKMIKERKKKREKGVEGRGGNKDHFSDE